MEAGPWPAQDHYSFHKEGSNRAGERIPIQSLSAPTLASPGRWFKQEIPREGDLGLPALAGLHPPGILL